MPQEAPGPLVPSCTEHCSPTSQPIAELLKHGSFPSPSSMAFIVAYGGGVAWASAGVTPAWCHCRWTDGSIINFISWAPGKPRPIGKDKKCVYMTASRGEGEVGQRGCGS